MKCIDHALDLALAQATFACEALANMADGGAQVETPQCWTYGIQASQAFFLPSS